MQTETMCLQQGADWRRVLTVADGTGKPVDLTGATAACHVKDRYRDPSPLIVAKCDITDAPAGAITIAIAADDTERLWVNPYERRNRRLHYVYDVVVTFSNGERRVLLRGDVEMMPLVTREVRS